MEEPYLFNRHMKFVTLGILELKVIPMDAIYNIGLDP